MSESPSLASDADGQAARMALLLLRASVPEQRRTDQIVLGDEGYTGSAEAVATRLAVRVKPLRCRSGNVGPPLEVLCDHLPSRGELATPIRKCASYEMALSRIDSFDAQSILLIGSGEWLRISARGLEAFTRDYVIDVPHSLSGDDPSPEQHAQGISWVIRAGPEVALSTRSVADLNLPEHLREVIAREFERTLSEHDATSGNRDPAE